MTASTRGKGGGKTRRAFHKGFDEGGGVPGLLSTLSGGPAAGFGKAQQFRRGGTITRTKGPPIGKDDGLIPAQKGEYVVRRSAVKKLGKKALDTINRGKLPERAKR